MRNTIVATAFLGLMFGLNGPVELTSTPDGLDITAGVTKAHAQYGQARRVSRRTSRRTSRRVARRHSLPAGCAWRAPYHYCGGVYYQAVKEGGTTVYIVVNP